MLQPCLVSVMNLKLCGRKLLWPCSDPVISTEIFKLKFLLLLGVAVVIKCTWTTTNQNFGLHVYIIFSSDLTSSPSYSQPRSGSGLGTRLHLTSLQISWLDSLFMTLITIDCFYSTKSFCLFFTGLTPKLHDNSSMTAVLPSEWHSERGIFCTCIWRYTCTW